MARAYVGLGANLGDREAAIRHAVELLSVEDGIDVLEVSALRETDPVGLEDQPMFLNGAAALETTWVEAIEEVDLDDLNPESLWKFRVRAFGPLLVSMDSHGGSLHTAVNQSARDKRAAALAALGVRNA